MYRRLAPKTSRVHGIRRNCQRDSSQRSNRNHKSANLSRYRRIPIFHPAASLLPELRETQRPLIRKKGTEKGGGFIFLKKWSIHHGYGSVEMRKPRIFLASSVEGRGVAFDLT